MVKQSLFTLGAIAMMVSASVSANDYGATGKSATFKAEHVVEPSCTVTVTEADDKDLIDNATDGATTTPALISITANYPLKGSYHTIAFESKLFGRAGGEADEVQWLAKGLNSASISGVQTIGAAVDISGYKNFADHAKRTISLAPYDSDAATTAEINLIPVSKTKFHEMNAGTYTYSGNVTITCAEAS